MSDAATLFENPVFRWGIGAFDAALLAAIGLFFVEDATVRLGLYGLAAASLVLTPMVLRRAAENQ